LGQTPVAVVVSYLPTDDWRALLDVAHTLTIPADAFGTWQWLPFGAIRVHLSLAVATP